VVFEKECYDAMLICWMNCQKRTCLEMMPAWCRQVNWGNCGIPWVNCAVIFVKDDWKRQFFGLRSFVSKIRSLISVSVRYDAIIKIVQFIWLCIGRLICILSYCYKVRDNSWGTCSDNGMILNIQKKISRIMADAQDRTSCRSLCKQLDIYFN
jgi:hypothetical protein